MKNDFQPLIKITWGVIILCTISIIALIKIYLFDNASQSEWWFLVYSIPLIIPALIFVVLLYNLKRVFAEGQDKLFKGEYLAKWRYSDEEWMQFNLREWKKSRKKVIGIPFAMLMLYFLFVLLDTKSSEDILRYGTPFVVLFFVGLSAGLYFYVYVQFKRTMNCPREVILGKNGFLYGGYYNTWATMSSYLAGVKYLPGDIPMIEFNVKVMGKGGYNSHPQRVPVPFGKEIEAQQIVKEFEKDFPNQPKR